MVTAMLMILFVIVMLMEFAFGWFSIRPELKSASIKRH